MQSLDFPSQQFETERNDYELYEEDGEFALGVEMPGFEPEEFDVTWNDGVLNIRPSTRTRSEASGRPTTAGSASRRTWTTRR
jgi:HSP20 family protein